MSALSSRSLPPAQLQPTSRPLTPHQKSLPLLPRSHILSLILRGRLFVIYNSLILDLTSWADKHPGGKLAILHFVGRDATDEMEAYHSEGDLRRVGGFAVGRVEVEPWEPLTPPIALGLLSDPSSPTGWRREGQIQLATYVESLAGASGDGHGKGEDSDNESTGSGRGSGSNGGRTPSEMSEMLENNNEQERDYLHSKSSRPTKQAQQPSELYPTLTPAMLIPLPPSATTTTSSSSNPISSTSLNLKEEHSRSLAYRQLRSRIRAAGLFEADGWLKGYGGDLRRYVLLGAGAGWFYFRSTSTWGYMLSAVLLGAMWHQLTFIAHDAGHTGITGNAVTDRIIGTVVADWIGGLSISWWKDNHNIHHLVTNHPEHDPDIQHIPFFAISPKFFGSMWSTYYKRIMAFDAFSRAMVSVQHNIYYLVLSLARFNLYANSYTFLALKMRRKKWFYFELAGLCFFWTWFGLLLKGLEGWKLRVGYLLVSHIVTSPVHVQIVLSHFARSTDDMGPIESFPTRQLRTTMDVVCNEWIEFFHGGLHLQVTHHLFPRIPRHNLRRASKLVKEYCKEQGLEYAEHSFTEGNRKVLGVLRDVANQVKFLGQVAEADARGELH